jgi:hypothetical protein
MDHRLMQQLIKLWDRVQDYGVQSEHCEELHGIAQNIIGLGLPIEEPLPSVLAGFTKYWETFGSDSGNFNMLYDCCMDTLSRIVHPILE